MTGENNIIVSEAEDGIDENSDSETELLPEVRNKVMHSIALASGNEYQIRYTRYYDDHVLRRMLAFCVVDSNGDPVGSVWPVVELDEDLFED